MHMLPAVILFRGQDCHASHFHSKMTMEEHLSEDQHQVYDRQLRVWGLEAQKRMQESKTLIAGLT